MKTEFQYVRAQVWHWIAIIRYVSWWLHSSTSLHMDMIGEGSNHWLQLYYQEWYEIKNDFIWFLIRLYSRKHPNFLKDITEICSGNIPWIVNKHPAMVLRMFNAMQSMVIDKLKRAIYDAKVSLDSSSTLKYCKGIIQSKNTVSHQKHIFNFASLRYSCKPK